MLMRAHRGNDDSGGSMKHRMMSMGRKLTMFDFTKEAIKDFNKVHDLLITLVEAHFLAAVATELGASSWNELCDALRRENWRKAIDKVWRTHGSPSLAYEMRQSEESTRDLIYENAVLFLQHGSVYKTFTQSMRKGNSDLIKFCLKFFTIWLHNSESRTSFPHYRKESLRLLACMKYVWSTGWLEYYLENCVVNFDGKEEGFMAADQACEHWIRMFKEDAPTSGDPANDLFYREKLAPQASHVREVRRKIYEAAAIVEHYTHSSRVDKSADIRKATEDLLCEGVFRRTEGRRKYKNNNGVVGPSVDLFGLGCEEIVKGRAIENLKRELRGEVTVDTDLEVDEITAYLQAEGDNDIGEE